MASRLFHQPGRAVIPFLGCTLLAASSFHTRCGGGLTVFADSPPRSYEPPPSTPQAQARHKPVMNARVIRQISAGSLAGLCGGAAVSIFSKPLAVVIGLAIVVIQALEGRGIHVVPYHWIQRRLRGVTVDGMMRENVPFKLCFGVAFALAAGASF